MPAPDYLHRVETPHGATSAAAEHARRKFPRRRRRRVRMLRVDHAPITAADKRTLVAQLAAAGGRCHRPSELLTEFENHCRPVDATPDDAEPGRRLRANVEALIEVTSLAASIAGEICDSGSTRELRKLCGCIAQNCGDSTTQLILHILSSDGGAQHLLLPPIRSQRHRQSLEP